MHSNPLICASRNALYAKLLKSSQKTDKAVKNHVAALPDVSPGHLGIDNIRGFIKNFIQTFTNLNIIHYCIFYKSLLYCIIGFNMSL